MEKDYNSRWRLNDTRKQQRWNREGTSVEEFREYFEICGRALRFGSCSRPETDPSLLSWRCSAMRVRETGSRPSNDLIWFEKRESL